MENRFEELIEFIGNQLRHSSSTGGVTTLLFSGGPGSGPKGVLNIPLKSYVLPNG